MNNYIRKDLRSFKPYHAPLKAYDIKLDANESPYLHDEMLITAMKEWMEDSENIKRYPDTDCTELRETIASYWKVKKDNVVCGVGSDQIIDSILKVFLEPNDKVMMPSPSFSMYKLSTIINHGIPIEFALSTDFSYSIEQILKEYHINKPKCVFLCTPNNPTGSILSIEDMRILLREINCPVIIDEAYGEFIQETMIDSINEYPNIIILKTFSKAYALAGLRVGYAIASTKMIDVVNICIPPYNLSAFSQYSAKYVIEHSDIYKINVDEIINNREILYNQLQKLKVIEEIYPSNANFILVKVRKTGIKELLEREKILVRDFGKDSKLTNYLRITVGTKEENNILINKLNAIKL